MPALPMHRLRRYPHVRVVLDAEPDMRGSFHSAAPPQADEALGAAAERGGMPKSENVANTTPNLHLQTGDQVIREDPSAA